MQKYGPGLPACVCVCVCVYVCMHGQLRAVSAVLRGVCAACVCLSLPHLLWLRGVCTGPTMREGLSNRRKAAQGRPQYCCTHLN